MRGFVSASRQAHQALIPMLQSRGVDVISLHTLPVEAGLLPTIRHAIGEADFVIFVYTSTEASQPALAFELGMALGSGVPVLPIALGARLPRSPLLAGLQFVQAERLDEDAIGIHLDIFLDSVTARGARTVAETQSRYRIDREPERGGGPAQQTGLDLEVRVRELLSAHGSIEMVPPDKSVDMVAWLNGLDASLNPVLVECTSRVTGAGDGSGLIEQVSKAVSASGAGSALIVTGADLQLPGTASSSGVLSPEGVLVFMCSVRQLEEAARAGALVAWLTRARYEAVHG